MTWFSQLKSRNRQPPRVAGWHLPAPRPTRAVYILALRHVALPLLLLLLLADLVLYLLFAGVLGRCYGVLCLVG
jgi:hypothetical protein